MNVVAWLSTFVPKRTRPLGSMRPVVLVPSCHWTHFIHILLQVAPVQHTGYLRLQGSPLQPCPTVWRLKRW